MCADEGYFPAEDGTMLFYRYWRKKAPNLCILFHGYGDHSGRYSNFVEQLGNTSTEFCAMDLRGQGRSKGERVYAEGVDQYANDALSFIHWLEKRGDIGPRNIFFLGHSFGALVALRALARKSSPCAGLILSSPCFELYGMSWVLSIRIAIKVLGAVFPHLVLPNLVKPKFLFRDSLKMKEYLNDRLVERRVTARLGNRIIEACQEAQRRTLELDVPILVLASGDDKIVNVKRTEEWFANVICADKRMIVFPNLYHEIFNEEHREPIKCVRNFLCTYGGGDEKSD